MSSSSSRGDAAAEETSSASSSAAALPPWAALIITCVLIALAFFIFIRFILFPCAHLIDRLWPSGWTMVTRGRKVHHHNGNKDKKKNKRKRKHDHRSATTTPNLEDLREAVRTSTPFGRATAAANQRLRSGRVSPAEGDREVLELFFDATHGSNPAVANDWSSEGGGGREGWLSDEIPLALWQGVTHDGTEQGRVTALSLPKNEIHGDLGSLRGLSGLVKLNLRGNGLRGSLAPLHPLSKLMKVNLAGNKLGGGLGPLGGLFDLRDLNLTDNSLTGTVHALGGLRMLETCALAKNVLRGTLEGLAPLATASLQGE